MPVRCLRPASGEIVYEQRLSRIYPWASPIVAEDKIYVVGRRRVVVLADLQTDRFGTYERRVLDHVIEEKPDLVLLTGDYVQLGGPEGREVARQINAYLREIRFGAPLGVFAVRGNVDGVLAELGRAIERVFLLELSDDEIVRRHDNRQVRREDDREEAVRERLRVYHAEGPALIDYYRKRGQLVPVNGSRGVDEVSDVIRQAIREYLDVQEDLLGSRSRLGRTVISRLETMQFQLLRQLRHLSKLLLAAMIILMTERGQDSKQVISRISNRASRSARMAR